MRAARARPGRRAARPGPRPRSPRTPRTTGPCSLRSARTTVRSAAFGRDAWPPRAVAERAERRAMAAATPGSLLCAPGIRTLDLLHIINARHGTESRAILSSRAGQVALQRAGRPESAPQGQKCRSMIVRKYAYDLVELWGFEPQTSCMPSAGSPSTGAHLCRSPSRGVRTSSPESRPVAVLSCCIHRTVCSLVDGSGTRR
jgi:hypothetical protein